MCISICLDRGLKAVDDVREEPLCHDLYIPRLENFGLRATVCSPLWLNHLYKSASGL